MILSLEEGRHLAQMIPSFRSQHDDIDDNQSEIALQFSDIQKFMNMSNCNLFLSTPEDDKPTFYIKKQYTLSGDDDSLYDKSLLKEREIFLSNNIQRIEYEKKNNTKIYNCLNSDESCEYSPFLSYGDEAENNLLKLPFYPALTLKHFIESKIEVTNTDKQVWAYQLASAFNNLHQRNLYHSYFSSSDVFLVSNENLNGSSGTFFNIVIGNFAYDVDSEKNKSSTADEFFYRCPEFINDPVTKITNATDNQLKKNDVYSYGVILNELQKFTETRSLFTNCSRSQIISDISTKSSSEYLHLDKSPWESIILQCTNSDSNNRPDFKAIKEYFLKEENFLSDVNSEEFNFRIQNVKTDTTCYFETLSYVNKKYPQIQIIDKIIHQIYQQLGQSYPKEIEKDSNLPIVEQLYRILNSSIYLIEKLITQNKLFFQRMKPYSISILKKFTDNEYLIELVNELIQNDGILQRESGFKSYNKELMFIYNKLRNLVESFYSDMIDSHEDIISSFHKKNLSYLSYLFGQSIPISIDQINIIYENIFDFDYQKTLNFLCKLNGLSQINENFFKSLQKIFDLLKKIFDVNNDVNFAQIKEVYKSIYKTIFNAVDGQKSSLIYQNPFDILISKIRSLKSLISDGDLNILEDCIKDLQDFKIQGKKTIHLLNYSKHAKNQILTSELKRENRIQTKKIEISGLSKSSLRSFLTRVLKNYQSAYQIEIHIRIDSKGSKDLIKMSDVHDALVKLGVENINTDLPNEIRFRLFNLEI